MTRDRTRTMVLRNSRSIQKHGTGCELSYCDMREAGCAFEWRSHVTKSCVSWDISDVTSCNALTSRRVSLWRHVFTSRPPAIRHIHVKKYSENINRFDLSECQCRWRAIVRSVQDIRVSWIYLLADTLLASRDRLCSKKLLRYTLKRKQKKSY